MARYFAGNTLAAFQRSKGTVVEATGASTFDSAFVSNSIGGTSGDTGCWIEAPAFSAVSPSEFWLHFEIWNTTGAAERVTLYNAGVGAYRFLVSGSSTTGLLQYWNTGTAAWVTVGSSFGFSGSVLHRLDLKIVPGVSMELFSAETTSLASGAVGANPQTTIDGARFHLSECNFSQIICQDSDTRGMRYMTAALNALGSYTDGAGAVGDINETVLDDTTFAQLQALAEKRSFTHSGITVPSTHVIGAAVLSARARVGGGTVTDGKLGVDSGATYEGGSGLTPDSQLGPVQRIVENDPDTASPWTETGFDASEIVLEAA